ncbi:MAG: hypothetical protein WCF10_00665 [Polyangiales bacterium]
MNSEKRYWFPAKRYGWGWGPPCAWQGWVVVAVYVASLVVAAFELLPAESPGPFVSATAVLTLIFVAVCWLTGEPPKWRWGDKR